MTVVFNETLASQFDQPPKASTWVASHIRFIKARAGSRQFYITAADDEAELIPVRCARLAL